MCIYIYISKWYMEQKSFMSTVRWKLTNSYSHSYFHCHTNHHYYLTIASFLCWSIHDDSTNLPRNSSQKRVENLPTNRRPTSSISSGRTMSLVCRINSGAVGGLGKVWYENSVGVIFWLVPVGSKENGDEIWWFFVPQIEKLLETSVHQGGFLLVYHMIQSWY